MNKKKIFVSYDYDNDRNYKNMLLAWDQNNKFDFSMYDHSVDVSVNSTNATAIKRVISSRINDSTYFLCIVGKETYNSDWVEWEIEKAIELRKKIVVVKTDKGNTTPLGLIGIGASFALSFTLVSITNALESAK